MNEVPFSEPLPDPIEAIVALSHKASAPDAAGDGHDPKQDAKAAHLRYVTDEKPGIRREGNVEEGFRYYDPQGQEITDEKTLARIHSIGLPPAYTNVWICPQENGHLQATGYDARGRKQYRYHVRWQEVRDGNKYDRMLNFGDALPQVRARMEHDLGLPGLPREKVLAAVVRLLEETRIRVGNREYARTNESFGLTTLRNEHVDVTSGGKLHFHFRGKSGKTHEINIKDPRVARVVRKCQELPGQDLFEYVDEEGLRHHITSSDVNDYLHEIAGEEFTAKDFRTWSGTVLAALCLLEIGPCENKTQGKKNVTTAVKQVAERLGNTPAVCRKAYIFPGVIEAYMDGTINESLCLTPGDDPIANHPAGGLSDAEKAVLEFLRERSQDTAVASIPKQKKKTKK